MEIKANALPLCDQGLPLIGAALCTEIAKQGTSDPALLLCVMLLCLKLQDGGVCLNLSTKEVRDDAVRLLLGQLPEDDQPCGRGTALFYQCLGGHFDRNIKASDFKASALMSLLDKLFGKELCNFVRGDSLSQIGATPVTGGPDDRTPLVWDLGRLYFRRYFNYEQAITRYVRSRPAAGQIPVQAKDILDALFGRNSKPDYQKCAAALSLLSPFTVISGGPGTGKTTTVTKILLAKLALMDPAVPARVMLAAPTGKAAARLSESIVNTLKSDGYTKQEFFDFENKFAQGRDLISLIPQRAVTVHSLIGVRPHSESCRNNRDNPLACDLLVVDEVSMVDMPLFAKLCAALPSRCSVVLLGDRDQLCSVEAGAVLADLSAGSGAPKELLRQLENIAGINDGVLDSKAVPAPHVALLRESHRFRSDSGIGRLAATINNRDITDASLMDKELSECFRQGGHECRFVDEKEENAIQNLLQIALSGKDKDELSGYGSFFSYLNELHFVVDAKSAKEALERMDKFRVLCSNRRGAYGTDDINRRIIKALRKTYGLPYNEWFPGRIVIVTRNNQSVGLANGDVGFCAKNASHEIRVWFPGGEDGARSVNPVFLSDSDDGFALTVHKSQGSEYENIALCLCPKDNPVLTRELVYTGVTRAKKHITVYADQEILNESCVRSTIRDSALAERISCHDKLSGYAQK